MRDNKFDIYIEIKRIKKFIFFVLFLSTLMALPNNNEMKNRFQMKREYSDEAIFGMKIVSFV